MAKANKPPSGGDHPPQAAYEQWLVFNPDNPAWDNLATDVQSQWGQIAQAAINAN
jgi:hypothetical protein